MSITVEVPAPLRAFCGGAPAVLVEAASVRAALLELERLHPAIHRSVCDETGAVRRHIGVFVNGIHFRDREGVDTRLAPGDVVTILPAVSGG
jgi:molybdopterin converting factor small subunit